MHHSFRILVLLFVLSICKSAIADISNLAEGFSLIPRGAKIVMLQPDVELSSVSLGGVAEPKADWTDTAMKHIRQSLQARTVILDLQFRQLSEEESDKFAEVSTLHAAVAQAISAHHFGLSSLNLPTKNGKLDWSLGEATATLGQTTNSDYGLFIWIRDSYATAERKAAMIAAALFGRGIAGGVQIGYASLVDLKSGQILWFNQVRRADGDLRDPVSAEETMLTLFKNFPNTQ